MRADLKPAADLPQAVIHELEALAATKPYDRGRNSAESRSASRMLTTYGCYCDLLFYFWRFDLSTRPSQSAAIPVPCAANPSRPREAISFTSAHIAARSCP